jgi:hypothetical protein
VYPRSLDPSVLVFSLSLYRHPSICILCSWCFSTFSSTHNRQHISFTFMVFSSVNCGIGSELSFWKIKNRNWVPKIELNYNRIPSEYHQIFLGIYVMSHCDQDVSPSLEGYVRVSLSRTMSPGPKQSSRLTSCQQVVPTEWGSPERTRKQDRGEKAM